MFLGVDPRREPLLSGISPKSHVEGQGWRVVERHPAEFAAGTGIRAVESVQRRLNQVALVISWQQGVEIYPIEATRNALGIDRSPWQRPFGATAVRISTWLESSSPRDLAAARARLRPFIERVLEHFPPPGEIRASAGPFAQSPWRSFSSSASHGHSTLVSGSMATQWRGRREAREMLVSHSGDESGSSGR